MFGTGIFSRHKLDIPLSMSVLCSYIMGMPLESLMNTLCISYRAPTWIIVALYDMVIRYELQVVDSIACAVPCIVINSCLSRKSYTKGCNFQSEKTEGIYKYVCYLSQPASAPQHFTFGNNTVRPTYDLFTFDPTTTWRTRLHASRTKIVKLQLHSTLYTIQDTVQ